jgi:hypothetical protein
MSPFPPSCPEPFLTTAGSRFERLRLVLLLASLDQVVVATIATT